MKKHRQGKETRKSFRIPELLLVFLMITAMVVPMGVKASETADGSASGASQAVVEEEPEKQKEKESSSASTAVKEESTKSASSSDESAGSSATERKEQKSDTSGNALSAGNDSAGKDKTGSNDAAGGKSTQDKNTSSGASTKDASASSTDSSADSAADKNNEKSGSAASVKADGHDDSQSSSSASSSGDEGSGTSKTESDRNNRNNEEDDDTAAGDFEQNKSSDTAAGDSEQNNSADNAGDDSDQSKAADNGSDGNNATDKDAGENDEAGNKSGQSADNAAEETTVPTETDETTITFEAKEVTVIADKAAFDGDVIMKVKKVTDPEQLLKIVTALKDEGRSYTVKAYTVSFYDKDGKEVEPKIPVQVNVNTKVSTPSKSKVVHVKDDDKTEVVDADIDRTGASFELNSFSDIGVATEQTVKIPGSSFEIYLGDELTTEFSVDDLPAGPISEEALPEVEGYSYENATVNGQQVEEIGTITDVDGNVYVYYTTKDGNGTIKAEILGDGRIRINLVETETASTYDLEASGAHVHIEAPAGAFDKDTYMVISTVELTQEQQTQVQEQAAEVLGQDASMRIQAVDITFYDKDGNEVQPREAVQVELTTPEAVDSDFCVVHLGDTADRVEAQISEEGKIQFNADAFSVYAVVDEETPTVEEARMTLNFYNGSDLIATVYVKNGDDTDEVLEQIIYDPGAGDLNSGELFKGWILDKAAYTTEDLSSKMTVEDIRTWAKGKASNNGIVEGEEHNFYAMIFKTFSVAFKDENGATIHSEALIFASTEESVDYTIDVAYTPKEQDEAFMGWYWQNSDSTVTDPIVAKDGSEQPFVNGTEVTIKDDL